VALVVKFPHFFDSLNGLRYLRWGGDGEAVQLENCLKTAQNPQRRVHAVLGSFYFHITVKISTVLMHPIQ